jgi:hypothetical protein
MVFCRQSRTSDPDGYDLWLDPGMQNVNAASDLLEPFDARLMRSYPVSVGSSTWLHVAKVRTI